MNFIKKNSHHSFKNKIIPHSTAMNVAMAADIEGINNVVNKMTIE